MRMRMTMNKKEMDELVDYSSQLCVCVNCEKRRGKGGTIVIKYDDDDDDDDDGIFTNEDYDGDDYRDDLD